MSSPDENSEKPFEPTQRKLDDARRKGEIARSSDLFVFSSYGGLLLVAATIGGASLITMGGTLSTFLARPEEFAPMLFEGSAQPVLGGWMSALGAQLAPWFLAPALSVVLMVIWQKAALVTPSKLAPKPSRISPISNARNKYGRSGLFEFAKSFAKLVIYSICLALFLRARMAEISFSAVAPAGQAVRVMLNLLTEFMVLVLVVAGMIGAVDYMWQKSDFLRRQRMSLKEMRDESKESEGDPHLKQERRQRAMRMATNQMLQDVPKADVVIVNPTHYAVALKWSRQPGSAPECVAKGLDEVAARIRRIAIEHSVPVRHDPPTARALFASVEIGAQIDRDHYRAVAAAIRFAEKMRGKAGVRA